jgi:hypothetical protein
MITITVHLTSNEWELVRTVAKQWPRETLSQTELSRRCILYGADALMHLPETKQQQLQREFRQSVSPDAARWHGKLPGAG